MFLEDDVLKYISAKTIDSCKSAQSAQDDLGQSLLHFMNFLHIQGLSNRPTIN